MPVGEAEVAGLGNRVWFGDSGVIGSVRHEEGDKNAMQGKKYLLLRNAQYTERVEWSAL